MVPTPFRACSPTKGGCVVNFFCDRESLFCSPCKAICNYDNRIPLPEDCLEFCQGNKNNAREFRQRQQKTRDQIKLPSTASSALLPLTTVSTSLSPASQQTTFTKGGLQTDHLESDSQNNSLHSSSMEGLMVVVAVILCLVVTALVVAVLSYMIITIKRSHQAKQRKTAPKHSANYEEYTELSHNHCRDAVHKPHPKNCNEYKARQELLINQGKCQAHTCTGKNQHLQNKIGDCYESSKQKLVCSLSLETGSYPGLHVKNSSNNCQYK